MKNIKKVDGLETIRSSKQDESLAMLNTNKLDAAPQVTNKAGIEMPGYMNVFGNDMVSVFAGKAHDSCTRIEEIILVVVYRDGHVCPPKYYKKTQLRSKMTKDLFNMAGFTKEDIATIYKFIYANQNAFSPTVLSNGKASIQEAYQALIDYAKNYRLEHEVYIEGGYANIKATLLQDIITRLGLGYNRLELKKALRAMGLLRSNADSTGHFYDYKIGPDWFVSLKIV